MKTRGSNRFYNRIFTLLLLVCMTIGARAQYYEIANQLPNLISPALSGSFNYKGYVDVDYMQGLGKYKANVLDISTSQGFKYSNWFFMGVGLGVDVLFSHTESTPSFSSFRNIDNNFDPNHKSTSTAVMIPIFTDFRFNIGNQNKPSFFFDVKIGCSFLCSNTYIQIDNGYLTNQQYFYLKPSVGVRIPTNSNNSKQAFNVGITYQMMTSNYWSSWDRNVYLNGLGINASYEW